MRSWVIAGVLLLAILAAFTIIGSRDKHRNAPAQVRPAVVDVNRATFAELNALPNVSDAVAQAIIDGRPYSSVDDLIRVYGIGPKTLERIRPYVKVDGSSLPPPTQRSSGTAQKRATP
jgi:competence protein ComEA